MNYALNKIPFFSAIDDCQNILLAGAGGGFDIYAGLPLYFNLKAAGKNVTLANFSFTWLSDTTAEQVAPFCYKVQSTDEILNGSKYFPEKYLQMWLRAHNFETDLYAFERTGVLPLRDAYKFIIDLHKIDAVVLVDGGTDSLMFGDEQGLGTPQEDIASMAAVFQTGIKKQFLVSVGFGVDHFHGVSHYRFLENVATLAKEGGYLGLFQMTKEMQEAQMYADAVFFSNQKMENLESIVSNSIVSALKGDYGNQPILERTLDSILWINPLMTIFWCFDLPKLIGKVKYYDFIKDTTTLGILNGKLKKFRDNLVKIRQNRQIPI